MSLKHKNTSKWAKAQNKYAKYSERARDQVQEQLELSKQLTKKVKQVEPENDDEHEGENEENNKLVLNQNGLLANNPWMKMMKGVGQSNSNEDNGDNNKEMRTNDEFSKPKAFNDKTEIERAQKELDDGEESGEESEDSDDMEIALEKESNKNVANIFKKSDESSKVKSKKKKVKFVKDEKEIQNDEIPQKTVQETKIVIESNIEPVFESRLAKNVKIVDESNHDDEDIAKDHQITLSEAFADDDVIEEFKMEKVIMLFISLAVLWQYLCFFIE